MDASLQADLQQVATTHAAVLPQGMDVSVPVTQTETVHFTPAPGA